MEFVYKNADGITINEALSNLKNIRDVHPQENPYINVFINEDNFRLAALRKRYLVDSIRFNKERNIVELMTTQFPEEELLVPPEFITINDLIDKLEKYKIFFGMEDTPNYDTKICVIGTFGIFPFKPSAIVTKDKGINNFCIEYYSSERISGFYDNKGNLQELQSALDSILNKNVFSGYDKDLFSGYDPDRMKSILEDYLKNKSTGSDLSKWYF